MVAMSVFLSTEPASEQWGNGASLSLTEKGAVIHFLPQSKLETVQKVARKLDGQGIKRVALQGEHWDLESCWHFWLGFKNPKGKQTIDFPELDSASQTELKHRIKIVGWVRDTINAPAEQLTPEQLAENAAILIHQVSDDVSYSVIQGEALHAMGYNGIYTVGKGSLRPPALLVLDYNPSENDDEPVFACLVGKGITFDSGGYSLKQSAFMDSMKADMGGAALATGALALAITRGLKKRVKLILCCAENLVSGTAFKLGDVIQYRNGKTVEVMNTDAEGRLVLADGLIEAEKHQPQLIIDCATLTGAAKVAVGNDYHSVLSFDDALAADLLSSATTENEPFWRLPLAEMHREQTPSAFADLSNVAGGAHTAGASTAAGFLSHFLNHYQTNWLHIDCSATYRKSAVDKWATGATGLGVRSLANLLLMRSVK